VLSLGPGDAEAGRSSTNHPASLESERLIARIAVDLGIHPETFA
jgi:hypothetical protein